jgi:hypothetical protein
MTDAAIDRTEWAPDGAVHPGAILEEHLETRGLSRADYARLAG